MKYEPYMICMHYGFSVWIFVWPSLLQAILIFTNGNTAPDSERLDVASWPLRGRKNIRIIAISVGDSVNEKQLNNVVSLPASDNVFLASNYDDIQKNIKAITKVSCKPGTKEYCYLCN